TVGRKGVTMELHTRLIEAGRAVFARAGYAGATVDDVIADAATSRATFYRYFHNKDELFDELSRQCFADMDVVIAEFASLADSPGGPLAADVAAVLDRYRTLHARHGGVIRAWFE